MCLVHTACPNLYYSFIGDLPCLHRIPLSVLMTWLTSADIIICVGDVSRLNRKFY